MTTQQFQLAVQIANIFIQFLGLLAIAASLIFLALQTRAARQQTAYVADTNTGMMLTTFLSASLQILGLLYQHPELYDYFYKGESIDADDPNYPRVYFVGIMFLDFLDSALLQQQRFPQIWPANWWDEWGIDMFTTAPVLRAILDATQRWYSREIVSLKQIAEQRLQQSKNHDV